MKNFCYLVSEFGGHWDGYWERPIKVFIDKENAEEFVKENSRKIQKEELVISTENMQKAYSEVYNNFPVDYTEGKIIEGIERLHPDWNPEDIRKTDLYITREEMDWIGYNIIKLEICQ